MLLFSFCFLLLRLCSSFSTTCIFIPFHSCRSSVLSSPASLHRCSTLRKVYWNESQFLQSNLHGNENLIEFPFLGLTTDVSSNARWSLLEWKCDNGKFTLDRLHVMRMFLMEKLFFNCHFPLINVLHCATSALNFAVLADWSRRIEKNCWLRKFNWQTSDKRSLNWNFP